MNISSIFKTFEVTMTRGETSLDGSWYPAKNLTPEPGVIVIIHNDFQHFEIVKVLFVRVFDRG